MYRVDKIIINLPNVTILLSRLLRFSALPPNMWWHRVKCVTNFVEWVTNFVKSATNFVANRSHRVTSVTNFVKHLTRGHPHLRSKTTILATQINNTGDKKQQFWQRKQLRCAKQWFRYVKQQLRCTKQWFLYAKQQFRCAKQFLHAKQMGIAPAATVWKIQFVAVLSISVCYLLEIQRIVSNQSETSWI